MRGMTHPVRHRDQFISVIIAIVLSAMSATTFMAKPARAEAPADWMLGPFVRPEGIDPLIKPDPASEFVCPIRNKPVHWEAGHTFNPAAIVLNGKVWVLYRAEDDSGSDQIGSHTSRLGLAESDDGLHFVRRAAPVFYPDDDDRKANEWPGGCEDPRLIAAEDGSIVLTYTQWNQKIPRLAIATSPDLIHWKKYGPAFADASHGPTRTWAASRRPLSGG